MTGELVEIKIVSMMLFIDGWKLESTRHARAQQKRVLFCCLRRKGLMCGEVMGSKMLEVASLLRSSFPASISLLSMSSLVDRRLTALSPHGRLAG